MRARPTLPAMATDVTRIHGTCVSIEGFGVLLRGPPGSGKSDLALRLIDSGARLVADDWAEVAVESGRAILTPPEPIAGLIEARGLGVLALGAETRAPLALVVDLVEPGAVERLPEPARCAIAGVEVPLVRLAAFEASASTKVRLALKRVTGQIKAVP
jgi:serine kinase of HPr protein (carbohydrate metabolism regulator)